MDLKWAEDEELDAEVLRGLMLEATATLEMATADLKNPRLPRPEGRTRDLVEELHRLASSGVTVRLLHSGVPSESFLTRMRETRLHEVTESGGVPGSFTMRRCIRCHLKMIVVDGERMYLGTANLTGAGLGAKSPRRRNFEAGVVTSEAEFVRRGRSLFSAIWDGIFCDECDRKKYCPVPLEEPGF